jgi:hypothetical protein
MGKEFSVTDPLFVPSTSSLPLISCLRQKNLTFQQHRYRKELKTDTKTLNISWFEWQVNCKTSHTKGMVRRIKVSARDVTTLRDILYHSAVGRRILFPNGP